MTDIQNVLVLGAGRMGSQIALQCAFNGCDVALYDPHLQATDISSDVGQFLSDVYPERPFSTQQIEDATRRVKRVRDLEPAAAQAELLIEAVSEKLSLKREVLARCHSLCPPQTLFATNSSAIAPSSLAEASGRPDRFGALHFARASGIVEVMPHPGTSPATLEALAQFARLVGTLTITCRREHAGHVLNTLLMSLNHTALTLAENGIADPEDIDRIWMKSLGARTGPFGLLDDVGVETAWQITDFMAKLSRDQQQQRNAAYLKRLLDQGRAGRDCGRGFYDYPNPSYLAPGFLADQGALHSRSESAMTRGAELRASTAKEPDTIMSRFVLRMVEAPLRHGLPAAPQLHGAAAILGKNALAETLQERLMRLGVTVHALPINDDPQATVAALEQLWESEPILHLFLTTARDTSAADYLLNPGVRAERNRVGVILPFLVTQKWFDLVSRGRLLERASLVAATALGGDFGLGGNGPSVEGGGLAGLLKGIATEEPRLRAIKVVDAPLAEPADTLAETMLQEIATGGGDNEVGLVRGRRKVIRAMREPADQLPRRNVVPEGAWVVTGGARGITAYVARELAQRYQLTLHLLGTTPISQPGGGSKVVEIEASLRAFRDAGVRATYHVCDLAHADSLQGVLEQIRATDGPISGIVHGAGFDVAGKFERQQLSNVLRVLSPKLDGTANLMHLTSADPVRFFIGFGSTSGRFGAYRNADYSLANDMLCKMVSAYRGMRPDCAAFCIHWTAWDDVGMCMRPASRVALAAMKVKLMPAKEGAQHLIAEILADSRDREIIVTDHPNGVHSHHITMPRQ